MRNKMIEALVCSRCGAPLSEKNLKCEYCGTWHMDLSNMSKTISETIADLERENRMLMISDMIQSQNRLIIEKVGRSFQHIPLDKPDM